MSIWNDRYSQPEYVYGTRPNDFLASVAANIPRGAVLSLAEGEGRNAAYLARLGCSVTAVDSSAVGLEKAHRLAAGQGVQITTIAADLANYAIQPASWDAIISIFCHVPSAIRLPLHRAAVGGLKPGGVLVLEAFTPRQLEFKTGGPGVVDLLMTLDGLRDELAGLRFLHAAELEREVLEGKYHTGRSAVVQILAVKDGG